MIASICKLLVMVKSRTNPYHPQSDGLVERYNRTLLTMLATAVREHPFKWAEHLCRLCLAYNTSVKSHNRILPFFLMFGRQLRMPVEIMYGSPTQRETTVPQYVADLQTSLTAAYTGEAIPAERSLRQTITWKII